MGLVTVFGLVAGLMKLLAIGWTAFLVMMAGAEMGRRAETTSLGRWRGGFVVWPGRTGCRAGP